VNFVIPIQTLGDDGRLRDTRLEFRSGSQGFVRLVLVSAMPGKKAERVEDLGMVHATELAQISQAVTLLSMPIVSRAAIGRAADGRPV
jgi:hypothetical protein